MIARRNVLRSAGPLAVAAFGGLGLVACREEPMHQSQNVSFVGRGSMRERADQIRRAATELGWATRELRVGGFRGNAAEGQNRVFTEGLIEATNVSRGHNIVVNISYDSRRFTIRYMSSVGLNYDGVRIHTFYNGQVESLERGIMRASV